MKLPNSYKLYGKLFSFIIFVILLFIAMIIIAVPLGAALMATITLTLIFFTISDIWAMLFFAISLSICLAVLEFILSFSILNPNYFRPNERYAAPSSLHYQKNVRARNFHIPYGDLYTMTARTEAIKDIIEPRNVDFITDSLGFRNRADYNGEKIILFGDSFVVGNGTSQEDIISEVMSYKYGLKVYNAGFPGTPEQYLSNLSLMTTKTDGHFKAVFFMFEGNDFMDCKGVSNVKLSDYIDFGPNTELFKQNSTAVPITRKISNNIPEFIRKMEVYRLFASLYESAEHIYKARKYVSDNNSWNPQLSGFVTIWNVNPTKIGFFKEYIEYSLNKKQCPFKPSVQINYSNLRKDIALIVFVPTKFRVYYSQLAHTNAKQISYNNAWEYVKQFSKKINVPSLDLTPALVKESKRLLLENKYTWWRDDTHWNRYGINIGAEEVSKKLIELYGSELEKISFTDVSRLKLRALPPNIREQQGLITNMYNYNVTQ